MDEKKKSMEGHPYPEQENIQTPETPSRVKEREEGNLPRRPKRG